MSELNTQNLKPSSPEAHKVLVVDDESDIRALLCAKLVSCGYIVDQASNIDEALAAVSQSKYNAILLDLFLGETNSLDTLSDFFSKSPNTIIAILTAHGSIDFAVNAMKKGASGFLVKTDPLQVNIKKFQLLLDQDKNKTKTQADLTNLGIIGESDSLKALATKLQKLKEVDSTVLLQGESGTGKELFARAIHTLSNRSASPFIAINCAAISENILESELFGYKRGAFTDAKNDRKGYFETCTNGTLFLDEIGEMSQNLQSKLLRVLQEKEVTPLGSCIPVPVNTRIIAATNQNLKNDIRSKKFRDDLYYRLAVFQIELPLLKDRISDIPALVKHFIHHYNKRFSKEVLPPPIGVYTRLMAYDWPGNIRELQNAVERAVVLSEDNILSAKDLLPHSKWGETEETESQSMLAGLPLNFQNAKATFEKKYINNLLAAAQGNITEAARISGQFRPNVYRLINKHQVDSHLFKGSKTKA